MHATPTHPELLYILNIKALHLDLTAEDSVNSVFLIVKQFPGQSNVLEFGSEEIISHKWMPDSREESNRLTPVFLDMETAFKIRLRDSTQLPRVGIEVYEEIDAKTEQTCLIGYAFLPLPLVPGELQLQLPLVSPHRREAQKLLKVSSQFVFKDFFVQPVSR